MATMNIYRWYESLPVALQNLACTLEGVRIQTTRYNRDFLQKLAAAEHISTLSAEELFASRDRRLSTFIRHAIASVPHYRDLFRELRADPNDFKSIGDLASIPPLTKSEVQESSLDFLSSAVPRGHRRWMRTSGTTGTGLRFATTGSAVREQYATWWRHLREHGIEFSTWRAYFGGRSIVPVQQATPPFWRVDLAGRQILFSAYHASPDNMRHYLAALRDRRPIWWHGYPSQIALLATSILQNGEDLGYQPKWITTSSETLTRTQADRIEAAFGVRPIQNYGLTEAVASASQCPNAKLHVDELFSAVEFVPVGTDGLHRVLGTNLSNLATPLIRYDTGDLVVLGEDACTCGRHGRVIESIDGRREAYVQLPNGTRIGRLDHVFKDMIHVREAQIQQSAVGEVKVVIVKGLHFGEADEQALQRELQSRLGKDTAISIQYVSAIPRTRSGKLRFVVSNLTSNSN